MKAVTIALVAGVTLATGAATASAEGVYAGGQIGFGGGFGPDRDESFRSDTFEHGIVVGGFVGTYLGSHGRLEGELAYRYNDMASRNAGFSGEMSSLALMGNIFYDFGDGVGFTPYVGIGAGIANVRLKSASLGTDDTAAAFALQAIAGASLPLEESMSVTIEARYFGTPTPTFTNDFGVSFGQSYAIHSVIMGLRKDF